MFFGKITLGRLAIAFAAWEMNNGTKEVAAVEAQGGRLPWC